MSDERLPAARVSDAEREQVATLLREAHTDGRLTLDELDERLGEAYGARTRGELERATRELPVAAAAAGRRPTRFVVSIFGGAVRRGRLRLRRLVVAFSVLSDLDLDLRQATLEDGRATILILALFGNADVYVPEGTDADAAGAVLFGHCRDWGRDDPLPGAPRIRVRVLSLFGTADVWRVPHGATGSYRELIDGIRATPPALSP